MQIPQGTERAGLIREEWDFRPRPGQRKKNDSKKRPKREELTPENAKKFERFGFLPEDQVSVCYEYERARLDTRHAKEILKWRTGAKEQSFRSLLSLRAKQRSARLNPRHEFYAYWPEWPDQPFLKVPEAERRERWSQWTQRLFGTQPPLPHVGFDYLLAHSQWIPSRPGEDKSWAGEFAHSRVDPRSCTITFNDEGADLPPGFRWRSNEEIAAFRVNFSQPNETLASQFIEWLRKRRAQNGIPNPETRGEASFIQRARKALLTLGVWRLKEVGGMTSEEAIEHTEKASGKPLFAKAATWSSNYRQATGKDGGIGIAMTAHWLRTRSQDQRGRSKR